MPSAEPKANMLPEDQRQLGVVLLEVNTISSANALGLCPIPLDEIMISNSPPAYRFQFLQRNQGRSQEKISADYRGGSEAISRCEGVTYCISEASQRYAKSHYKKSQ